MKGAKDMIEGWWAHKEILQCVTLQQCRLDHGYLPVFIVPATPEAMEQLVEKVARAIAFRNDDTEGTWELHVGEAFAALSAVFGKGGR